MQREGPGRVGHDMAASPTPSSACDAARRVASTAEMRSGPSCREAVGVRARRQSHRQQHVHPRAAGGRCGRAFCEEKQESREA